MERKNFNWLLFQLSQRQIPLNFLEVGFCRRNKLLDWYCLNSSGHVYRNKVTAPSNLVKFLLSYFLSKRSPVLDEYKPDKQICYLYHRTGRKIINAKEAAEMLNNQLHGLDIVSIHMALPGIEDNKIYRAYCANRGNELCIEINIKKFDKDKGNCIKDMNVADKIVNFIVGLCEVMGRFSKNLHSMNLDLVVSNNLQVFLIKIDELCFMGDELNGSRDFQRVTSFKIDDDDSSEEISDNEVHHNIIMPEKDQRKKEGSHFKVPLSKPAANNSAIFLEMIAKTIQKRRKSQFFNEYVQKKVECQEESRFSKMSSFLFSGRDTYKEISVEGRLDSLSDLLTYLEKTRPRVWIRDTTNSLNKITTLKPPTIRNLSQELVENHIKKEKKIVSLKNKIIKSGFILHKRSASDSKLPPIKLN